MKHLTKAAVLRRETGFTLIELLTVIVIIGIIAAIAIPVFSSQRARAQDAAAVSEARSTVVAMETLAADQPNGMMTSLPSDIVQQLLSNGSTAKAGDNLKTKISFGNGSYYVSTQSTNGKANKCFTSTSATGAPQISGAGCNYSATFVKTGSVGDLSTQTFTVSQTMNDVIALDSANLTVTP